MKAQRAVHLVDHRQAYSTLLAFRAVFSPAVQRRQRVELALDGPVGADGGFLAAQQPHAQHLLQVGGQFLPFRQAQALLDQLVPYRGAVVRIHGSGAYSD